MLSTTIFVSLWLLSGRSFAAAEDAGGGEAATPAASTGPTNENHQLFRVLVKTPAQRSALQRLTEQKAMDVWAQTMTGVSDILATDENSGALKQFLAENHLEFRIGEADELMKAGCVEAQPDDGNGNIDWKHFYRYETIRKWLQKLQKKYPKRISVTELGQTLENRSIDLVTIKGGKNPRTNALIDCLIHAREWAAGAVCTYAINELVTKRNKYEDLLSEVQFYFIPIVNPDGYVFSQEVFDYHHRMWRKNRRPNNGNCRSGLSFGVDLNRNWPYQWGDAKASHCSEIYPGPSAGSELEIQALTKFLISKEFDTYVNIHSYAQAWLIPYAYKDVSESVPDRIIAVEIIGKAIQEAIKEYNHGTNPYEVGTPATYFGAVGGSSLDFGYDEAKAVFTFAPEIRPGLNLPILYPNGTAKPQLMGIGFCLNESEILDTAKENWIAIQIATSKKKDGEYLIPFASSSAKIVYSVNLVMLPVLKCLLCSCKLTLF